jgi:hypothetical protein
MIITSSENIGDVVALFPTWRSQIKEIENQKNCLCRILTITFSFVIIQQSGVARQQGMLPHSRESVSFYCIAQFFWGVI